MLEITLKIIPRLMSNLCSDTMYENCIGIQGMIFISYCIKQVKHLGMSQTSSEAVRKLFQ